MASNKDKNMKPHNINMHNDLWKRLKTTAKRGSVSVADVVRDACEALLERMAPPE